MENFKKNNGNAKQGKKHSEKRKQGNNMSVVINKNVLSSKSVEEQESKGRVIAEGEVSQIEKSSEVVASEETKKSDVAEGKKLVHAEGTIVEETKEVEMVQPSATGTKPMVTEEEKKEKRPSRIELKDKSDLFKSVIDIALACEHIEKERKKLKNRNKNLSDEIKDLKEQIESLKGKLDATELLAKKRQEEIDQLREDVDHRNEVIQIQKADKVESSQEFKNALAAALKTYMQDFAELKAMEMTDEIGYAMAETLDGVFKILSKNGINI